MTLCRRAPRSLCLLLLLALGAAALPAEETGHSPPALPAPWINDKVKAERIAISPDGKLIATLKEGSEGGIILYDRTTAKELRRLNPRIGRDYGLLTFTPDSKRLLTHRGREAVQGVVVRYEVLVWEVATGKLLRRFDLPRRQGLFRRNRLGAQRYAASDKVLIVGGEDEVGTIYNLETGKALGDLPGEHRPKMLALSQDGKWLLTAGKDDKLIVWDVDKRKVMHDLYDHLEEVKAVAISADGAWCASITWHFRSRLNRVWVFDRVKGAEERRTSCLFIGGGDGLLFTPDGKTLIGYGYGAHHGLFVWDWQTSSEMRGGYPRLGFRDMKDRDVITAASMAGDGTLLTSTLGVLRLWDLKPPASAEPPKAKKTDKASTAP
jgi:WD40 repeat protein